MADDGFKPLTAYIVAAKRTAGGRQNGRLSGWHPVDLGATICDAVMEDAGIDGQYVDDVIFGCVGQNGAQAGNIARNVVLSSKKLPETVPGYSLDRQCGSSQQAIHAAAQAVMSGTQDCVLAGGVEIMSLARCSPRRTPASNPSATMSLNPLSSVISTLMSGFSRRSGCSLGQSQDPSPGSGLGPGAREHFIP